MPANIEFVLAVLLVIMFAALSASVTAFANKNSTAFLVCIVLSSLGLGAVVCAIVMNGVVYKNAVILDNKEQKAAFENIKRSLDNNLFLLPLVQVQRSATPCDQGLP